MIREMLLIGHHTALFFCHSQHKDRRRNVPQRVGAVFALRIDCMWLEIQSLLIQSNRTQHVPRLLLTFLTPARRNFLKPFEREISTSKYTCRFPFAYVSEGDNVSKLPLAFLPLPFILLACKSCRLYIIFDTIFTFANRQTSRNAMSVLSWRSIKNFDSGVYITISSLKPYI